MSPAKCSMTGKHFTLHYISMKLQNTGDKCKFLGLSRMVVVDTLFMVLKCILMDFSPLAENFGMI
jgi:hypothetical protein